MLKVNVMFLLIVITWYLLFLIFILFLYFKYSKPYRVKKVEKIYEDIPEHLSPIELSMLLYHKMTPNALSATIVYLIEKGIIIREGDTLYKAANEQLLSISQNNALELLFNVIGNGEKVDINTIDSFCKNNNNATDFLLAYDIWSNMAIREVMVSKQFFVQKMDYELVKWFQYLGYFLVILNFVLHCHYIFGYLIIVPAYFILKYFYKIEKRTLFYQEQFYKWLGFGNYLSTLTTKKQLKINKTWTLIYSILLNKIEHVEQILNEEQFFTNLDKSLQTCYRRAYLFGNRKI